MRHTDARMPLYYGKVIPASVRQEVNKLGAPRALSAGGQVSALYLVDSNGGRARTRTVDLLRVNWPGGA